MMVSVNGIGRSSVFGRLVVSVLIKMVAGSVKIIRVYGQRSANDGLGQG